MDSASPFAGVLLGQPSLRRRLRLGTFAALEQRLALRYELPPMDAAESAAYLRHHLALAGREDPLFSDDAVALLHQASRGIPRALNNLAVQALVACYVKQQSIVDEQAAAPPSRRSPPSNHPTRPDPDSAGTVAHLLIPDQSDAGMPNLSGAPHLPRNSSKTSISPATPARQEAICGPPRRRPMI